MINPMANDTSDHIIDNIRAELGRRRISQRELARRLGISSAAMNQRLTGVTRLPADDLVRIAAVLQVDPAALLKESAW